MHSVAGLATPKNYFEATCRQALQEIIRWTFQQHVWSEFG
jgi:hypothetical protein